MQKIGSREHLPRTWFRNIWTDDKEKDTFFESFGINPDENTPLNKARQIIINYKKIKKIQISKKFFLYMESNSNVSMTSVQKSVNLINQENLFIRTQHEQLTKMVSNNTFIKEWNKLEQSGMLDENSVTYLIQAP